MYGLNEKIGSEIKGILHGTGEVQRQNVASCMSTCVLIALSFLVRTNEIGLGARSGQVLWIGKKAFDRIPRRLKQLEAAGDVDEIREAVEADEGMAGVGLMPVAGAPGPAVVVDTASGGSSKGEGVEAAVEPVKHEPLTDIKTRFADESDGAGWLAAEIEEETQAGNRKTVLKWLGAQLRKEERAMAKILAADAKEAGKADAKAEREKAAAAKKEAKKGERAAAALVSKEEREAAKLIKEEERAKVKAEKLAAKEAASQFAGLPEVEVEHDIDLMADCTCPKCKTVGPTGEVFGLRRMRRIIYQEFDGATVAKMDEQLYRRVVEITTRVQSQCKKCRGSNRSKTAND